MSYNVTMTIGLDSCPCLYDTIGTWNVSHACTWPWIDPFKNAGFYFHIESNRFVINYSFIALTFESVKNENWYCFWIAPGLFGLKKHGHDHYFCVEWIGHGHSRVYIRLYKARRALKQYLHSINNSPVFISGWTSMARFKNNTFIL